MLMLSEVVSWGEHWILNRASEAWTSDWQIVNFRSISFPRLSYFWIRPFFDSLGESSHLLGSKTFVVPLNSLILPTSCLAIIRKSFLSSRPPLSFSKADKYHRDLVMCRKQPGIAIGRLCDKCDGKCPVCDSYVRPTTLVRICDECSFGNYQNKCVVCGGEVSSPGLLRLNFC